MPDATHRTVSVLRDQMMLVLTAREAAVTASALRTLIDLHPENRVIALAVIEQLREGQASVARQLGAPYGRRADD